MSRRRVGRRIKATVKKLAPSLRLASLASAENFEASTALPADQAQGKLELQTNSVPSEPTPDLALQSAARRPALPASWQFWGIVAVALSGSISLLTFTFLLRQPSIPNCSTVFWPFASASLRLYCAQESANKQTLEDLLAAIALVNNLAIDHPLRPEINRQIELWSTQILGLAEAAFNQGKLERAIKFAKQIPVNTSAHPLVQARIHRWRNVWAKGEAIYQRAVAELEHQDWRQAFSETVHLLDVDNDYWSMTQYEALNQRIMAAQMDESQLAKARSLARQGGLDNLVAALKLAQEIGPKSDFRKSAQAVMGEISRSMMDLAEMALARQDLQTALNAAEQIPSEVKLWEEAQDFVELAYATSWTWSGTIQDLEAAIAKARSLNTKRPLYHKAQALAASWKLEIQAVKVLNQAEAQAQGGSINNLMTAIAQVQQISGANPRWQAAQQQINRWTRQLQMMEDQPLLDQADQLAGAGDRAAWQSAIQQAQQIQPGRALYQEAQEKIQNWKAQLQLANQQQQQQQTLSQPQRSDLQSQQLIRKAQRLASQGTPQALASAMAIANQVPEESEVRFDAEDVIDQWGQQILERARSRAETDLPAAIAIAQQVPQFSTTYADAQFQIQIWKEQR